MSELTRPGRTEILHTRRTDPTANAIVRASLAGGARGAKTSAEMRGEPLTIGRSRTTSLPVDDATVSAVHVELTASPDGVRVRDLTSSNGTVYAGAFVNDIVVGNGATIRVGRTDIVVEIIDDQRPAAAFDIEEVGRLCGTSGPMRGLYALVRRVSPTGLATLVEGEDGTEKDLVARAIHDAGRAPDSPIVFVDCAGGGEIASSLLFGAGGALESARGGTLVLLEVDALPLEVQEGLQQALVAGANRQLRLVATSRTDLAASVNRERFREDLYEQLAAVRVRVPPLRDRADDIAALAYRVLQELPSEVEAARTIAKDALGELKRRPWPGNVRELRAVVERAALMASGPAITAADLAFERRVAREREAPRLSDPTDETLVPFKDAKRSLVDEFEHGYLARLMERANSSVTKAATLAGLERHHVRDLLRKHGLHPSENRGFQGAEMTSKLEPGDKIAGRYRIVERLGEGGMGTIWEVYNENVERAFAIKILNPRLARDPIGVQRFLEEAKAVGRIRHPGVVEIVDAGKLEDRRGALPYMVMEKLVGEPLDMRLRRGPLPLAEALRVVRDAALAVSAAHDAGIIHRDIKPANLFMHRPVDVPAGAPDIVKVLDFGISKSKHAKDLGLTGTGVLLGTPSYMSPEQLIGNVSEAPSDVWALGVVLYACLSGTLPFTAEEDAAVMMKIKDAPYAPFALALPPNVVAIVDTCLAKRPQDRPPSATALAAALDGALAMLTAPPPSPAPRPLTRSTGVPPYVSNTEPQQRPRAIAPLAFGVLGLVGVIGVFVVVGVRYRAAEPVLGTAPISVPEEPPTMSAPSASVVVDLGGVDDVPPAPSASTTSRTRPIRRAGHARPGPLTPSVGPAPSPSPTPTEPVDPLRKPGF